MNFIGEEYMGLNNLLRLNEQEAAQLLQDYWDQRKVFLGELARRAQACGIALPRCALRYRRGHLLSLGMFLQTALRAGAPSPGVPAVSPWLAELHDPIDANEGLSEVDIWFGVATSYAFAGVLLNAVSGAQLGFGREESRRYVYQNQPVIKGKWYDQGNVVDISPLAVARSAVRDIKGGEESADVLVRTFERITRYARGQGLICEGMED